MAAFGNFPWNRQIFAETVDDLFTEGKVKNIGFDVVFSDQGLPNLGHSEAAEGNLALGKTIHNNPEVVLAASYVAKLGILGKNTPLPLLYKRNFSLKNTDYPEMPVYPVAGPNWGKIGLIDEVKELLPMFAPTENQTYHTLALELALSYWGIDQSAVTTTAKHLQIQLPGGQSARRMPLILQQLGEINWFSTWESPQNHLTSLADVLTYGEALRTGTAEEKAAAEEFFKTFNDAIVLIGPTDPFFHDVSMTPMDGALDIPKVSYHGNMLKTLVSGRFLYRPPIWVNCLLIIGLGLAAASLSVRHRGWSIWQRIAAAITVLVYLPVAFIAFSRFDLILPMVAPTGAVLSCSFLAVLWQLGVEQGQRRRMKSIFGSYVSPQIVDEMIEHNVNPQVGGAEVEITALFSDIEAFSPMAEALTPNDLIDLMSQYLTECTHAIIENKGTLDKYVGDAIIAIYGAPLPCDNHAAAACHSALGMQEAQKALGKRWAGQGTRWPVLAHNMRTRVGLNTGLAVVGNLGSALRFNYTMMGDNVNLAQRMEAAAGVFGVKILTSATTQQEAKAHDPRLFFRRIDTILVPGRSKPVDAYELVGYRDIITPENQQCYELYEAALEKYFQRDWAGASAGFRAAAALEPRSGYRNPSAVLHKRCEMFIEKPPADDWNFAFQLTKGG